MDRNNNQRLIKTLVPESIIDTIEQAMEACKNSKDAQEFAHALKPYDLRKDMTEGMQKAFDWKNRDTLIIYKSALYQYISKAHNLKNMTDRVFGKKVKIYIDRSGYVSETTRNNHTGVRITVQLPHSFKRTDGPSTAPFDDLSALEDAPF
jgi:hypothetical protein